MIAKIKKSITSLDSHTLEVLKKSFSSSLVKILGMFFGVLISIALGRILGPRGLGIINLANQIVSILMIFSLLGMQLVIVKEVAIARNQKNMSHLGDVMHTSYLINGGLAIIVSGLLILATPILVEYVFDEPKLKFPLIIALIAMIFQVFSRIFSSGLVGYQKIWQSSFVENTLSIGIVGVILFFLWSSNSNITIISASVAFAIGRVFVTFVTWVYWKKIYTFKSRRSFIPRKLIKNALPLLIATLTSAVAAGISIIFLGWLSDASEVGLFSVAVRLGLLTSFFLLVVNNAVSSKIAAFFADKKLDEIQRLIRHISKTLIIFSSISLLVIFLGGQFFLSFWGEEFINAYWMLVILSIGQFSNISTGITGIVLIMCGEEKIYSKIAVLFVIITIILNYFFISSYGGIGAAVATAATVIGRNVVEVVVVKYKLKFSMIPFI